MSVTPDQGGPLKELKGIHSPAPREIAAVLLGESTFVTAVRSNLLLKNANNVLLSGKGVGDTHTFNLLPMLKVFAVKNVTLTFDRRWNNK